MLQGGDAALKGWLAVSCTTVCEQFFCGVIGQKSAENVSGAFGVGESGQLLNVLLGECRNGFGNKESAVIGKTLLDDLCGRIGFLIAVTGAVEFHDGILSLSGELYYK